METQDSLYEALRAIERELASVDSRAADLREAARVLRKLGATPAPSWNGATSQKVEPRASDEPPQPPESEEYPRTTDVAASVLRSREAHAHTTRQVMEEAQRRGLLNPELKKPYGTILEALKRLVDKEYERGFLRIETPGGETRWVFLPPGAQSHVYFLYTGNPESPTGDRRPIITR